MSIDLADSSKANIVFLQQWESDAIHASEVVARLGRDAHLRGTVVDLWIRTADSSGMQRISLDLLKPDAAGELAESLPFTAPWPGSEPLAARSEPQASATHPLLWTAVVGTAVVVGAVLVWALTRR